MTFKITTIENWGNEKSDDVEEIYYTDAVGIDEAIANVRKFIMNIIESTRPQLRFNIVRAEEMQGIILVP